MKNVRPAHQARLIFEGGIYRAATSTLQVESLYSAPDVYDTKFAADIRFPEGRRTAAFVSKPSSLLWPWNGKPSRIDGAIKPHHVYRIWNLAVFIFMLDVWLMRINHEET